MSAARGRRAESFDLVIIGGGPAGSTMGTLVKKYAPGKKVLLLEKSVFPRYHVGESLLIGVVPILKEMGVYEEIDAAGFTKKLGTTYVWGKDRTPWVADFTDIEPEKILRKDSSVAGELKNAWHVRRAEYDALLLTHAAKLGVEVRHRWTAESIIEKDGRIVGLMARDPRGRLTEIRSEYLADCSGQSGFLSRYRKIRRYDPRLGNVALHGYFKGARWKISYQGHPDKTKLFICSGDAGWFWYFPVDKDVISVGLVTHRQQLGRRSGGDLKKFFLSALARCPEIAPLLKDASLLDDFGGGGKDLFVVRDWSYLNVASCGPGWLAAGDACVFVDPILSSGVQLAHMAGQRAACTLSTAWGKDVSEGYKKLLWSDYNDYYQRSAAHFLATVLFWYGNDKNAARWWGVAQNLVRASSPFPVKSKQAFVVIAAGVQDYYERLYLAENLFSETPKGPEDYPLFEKGDWAKERGGRGAGRGLNPQTRLRLACRYETGHAFLPQMGSGLLRPLKRVKFLLHSTEDPLQDIFNPVRIVLPPHVNLLQRLDRPRTFGELVELFSAEQGYAEPLARRIADKFFSDLIMLGAVSVVRKRRAQG